MRRLTDDYFDLFLWGRQPSWMVCCGDDDDGDDDGGGSSSSAGDDDSDDSDPGSGPGSGDTGSDPGSSDTSSDPGSDTGPGQDPSGGKFGGDARDTGNYGEAGPGGGFGTGTGGGGNDTGTAPASESAPSGGNFGGDARDTGHYSDGGGATSAGTDPGTESTGRDTSGDSTSTANDVGTAPSDAGTAPAADAGPASQDTTAAPAGAPAGSPGGISSGVAAALENAPAGMGQVASASPAAASSAFGLGGGFGGIQGALGALDQSPVGKALSDASTPSPAATAAQQSQNIAGDQNPAPAQTGNQAIDAAQLGMAKAAAAADTTALPGDAPTPDAPPAPDPRAPDQNTPSGIPDNMAGLSASDQAIAQAQAAMADQQGNLPGNMQFAMNGGIESMFGTQPAAAPLSDPASLETRASFTDPGAIQNAPIEGLGSPFGAGPGQDVAQIQPASGLAWGQNQGFGDPDLGYSGISAPAASPAATDLQESFAGKADQLGALTEDQQAQLTTGLGMDTGIVPNVAISGLDPTDKLFTGTAANEGLVFGQPDPAAQQGLNGAAQQVAPSTAPVADSTVAAPPADSVPLPSSRPDTAPADLAVPLPASRPDSAPQAPVDATPSPVPSPGPAPDVAGPIGADIAPTTSPDAFSALNDPGSDGNTISNAGEGGGAGGGNGGGILASQLIEPIPGNGPADGTSPDGGAPADGSSPADNPFFPTITLGNEGSPLGNFNPELGLFAPAGRPGGAAPVDSGSSLSGGAGSIGTNGAFDALNNAG